MIEAEIKFAEDVRFATMEICGAILGFIRMVHLDLEVEPPVFAGNSLSPIPPLLVFEVPFPARAWVLSLGPLFCKV